MPDIVSTIIGSGYSGIVSVLSLIGKLLTSFLPTYSDIVLLVAGILLAWLLTMIPLFQRSKIFPTLVYGIIIFIALKLAIGGN